MFDASSSPDRSAIILGLNVAVEATSSGFTPLEEQHGMPLFGDLRWEGWAAALNNDMAERLIVIGGFEVIDGSDCPDEAGVAFQQSGRHIRVPRGYACCHALVNQHGVDPDRVSWRVSEGNTLGNVATIKSITEEMGSAGNLVLSTSHYHLPRTLMDASAAGIYLPAIPAEAYAMAMRIENSDDRDICRKELAARLGGGPLARRSAGEIHGIADKFLGTYKSISR